MKTTELVVEQVLIGGLVLLAAAPLFYAGVVADAFEVELGTAIALLGVIYLVGIIYDRYADTLMQDLDAHNRLWAGINGKARQAPEADPFPENKFRIEVLKTPAAAEYSDYLKTRIRLSRALTTLSPALSMAALVVLVDHREPNETLRSAAAFAICAAYLAAFIVKQSSWGWLRGYAPPRTEALLDPAVYASYVTKFGKPNSDPLRGPEGLRILANERLVWLALSLVLAEVALLLYFDRTEFWFVPCAGIAGCLLAGWAWWRIFRTFLGLLRDVDRFK